MSKVAKFTVTIQVPVEGANAMEIHADAMNEQSAVLETLRDNDFSPISWSAFEIKEIED